MERWWATNRKANVSSCVFIVVCSRERSVYSCILGSGMLGGMEEDPEVGDPPLAELVGLHFGLLSN
jgi:hypothetical protein